MASTSSTNAFDVLSNIIAQPDGELLPSSKPRRKMIEPEHMKTLTLSSVQLSVEGFSAEKSSIKMPLVHRLNCASWQRKGSSGPLFLCPSKNETLMRLEVR